MLSHHVAHFLATFGSGISAGLGVFLLLTCWTRWRNADAAKWAAGFWDEFFAAATVLVPVFAVGYAGMVWSLTLAARSSNSTTGFWTTAVAINTVIAVANIVWFIPTNIRIRDGRIAGQDLPSTRTTWSVLHTIRAALMVAAFVASLLGTMLH